MIKIVASKKEKQIYETAVIYRGYQTWKLCWASSYAEASRIMGVRATHLKNYGLRYKREEDVEFEGCQGFIDSGWIIFGEPGRKDLSRKKMPWDELTEIIDTYICKRYQNS